MSVPDWGKLRKRYPHAWANYLERQNNKAANVNLKPEDLARRDDIDPRDRAQCANLELAAKEFLDELAAAEWLTYKHKSCCRICDFELPQGWNKDNCPNPEQTHSLTDRGYSGPEEIHLYQRRGRARRTVGWMLALHGMNTRGSWQESFNWLVSTSYGRMVPVAIFKYGVIRPGVLSRARQDTLADELTDRIRRASDEVLRIVRDPRPDVIAHSFGTLLLGNALHRDADLRVGRVITLGCILRPDFDWATLVERGQVEAVLNHFGTADQWAKRAHATIPDAGPAGRRGFDFREEQWPEDTQAEEKRVLLNVPAKGFLHSDFFHDEGAKPTKLESQFIDVWRPFLTTEEISAIRPVLEEQGKQVLWPRERWRPGRWPLRAVTGGWRAARFTYASRDQALSSEKCNGIKPDE